MPKGVSASASRQIVEELSKSSAYLILLGPEVSKRPWTQAWISYEDGVFTAFANNVHQTPYKSPTMFLVEDISQCSDAALPFFETALLLDFSDVESWPAAKTVLKLINPTIPLNHGLLVESNSLRLQNLAILRFQCPNTKCNSSYDIHIWMGRRVKRRLGIPNPPRSFSMKCSVCRSSVNIRLKKSQSGPPCWNTVPKLPRSNSLPLTHIARLV